ncbi:MAG TPA: alkaline phosphatase family protein, partial [Kofleriaceae bacterium]
MALAGTLAGSGCTGDTGPVGVKGDKGDPGAPGAQGSQGSQGNSAPVPDTSDPAARLATRTAIKHVVILFGENVSFDHYFATYPDAQFPATRSNPPSTGVDGTAFVALAGTPKPNGLKTPLDVNNNFMPLATNLLAPNNPNSAQPFRLNPSQASTQDQNHAYGAEQAATNAGGMNLFPEKVGRGNPSFMSAPNDASLVMGYYDGNTVTALWSYAQHFAMNDNSWTTQFGPSTPGALNLISGQTNGATVQTPGGSVVADGHGSFTVIGDPDPIGDVCSNPAITQVQMSGKNIGDLLNAKNITWGSFMGGFDLTVTNPNGSYGCLRITNPTQGPFTGASVDYIPHHAWFQYYASTANLQHLRPSSLAAIGSSKTVDGKAEPANHNYDSHDFFEALAAGNLPAVSFVKAPAFQDGHGGYSNPIDEQTFIATTVNALQASKFWATTAVIIAYDDSDGWYDHQAPPIVNPSSLDAIGNPASVTDAVDQLNNDGTHSPASGTGACTTTTAQQGQAAATTALPGAAGMPVLGRCGYGTRMPLLVISPFAKKNFIDHTLTDQ